MTSEKQCNKCGARMDIIPGTQDEVSKGEHLYCTANCESEIEREQKESE